MDDPAVIAALAAAAQRGVDVTITMTADPEWDQAFAELARAGAHIRLYADSGDALYIHAKVIVADAGLPGQRVLVGSQNFSAASLGYNRELGILTANPAVVAAISATLASDYAGATPYSAAASGTAPAKVPGAWCTARQASTTPPTTRTTSTSTPTSHTSPRPRPPTATRTPTRPTARAMH